MEAVCLYALIHSCLSLSDTMDCSPPGSFVLGILQARLLEWVAISLSRGSSRPTDQIRSPALQADSVLSCDQGSHKTQIVCLTPHSHIIADPQLNL